MKTITFNDALEIVESLPEEQRESLIEIVKNISEKNEGIGLRSALRNQERSMHEVISEKVRYMTLCARLQDENAYME